MLAGKDVYMSTSQVMRHGHCKNDCMDIIIMIVVHPRKFLLDNNSANTLLPHRDSQVTSANDGVKTRRQLIHSSAMYPIWKEERLQETQEPSKMMDRIKGRSRCRK